MPHIHPLSFCVPTAHSLSKSTTNPLYGPDFFTDMLFELEDQTERIRSSYENKISEGEILNLPHPAILWYVIQKGNLWFSGFVTGIGLEDIKKGKISLHEHVMQKRVDDFANYLSTTGLQAEPVLLFHNHHKGINALEDEICKRQPDHYYRLENERHELWILSEAQEQQLQDYCKSLSHFHLADGHHRLQSTLQWAEKEAEVQHLLSFVISKKEVSNGSFIWGLKKWPSGLDSDRFLQKLQAYGAQPATYYDRLGPNKQILIEVENKVYALNPEINLDNADFIYKELLGFKGNSVSNAKAYFDYFPNRTELDFDSIASDKYCAQFAATPLSVDRLIERALSHQKLPPKSTFIRPKIPTGLLVHKQEKNKK